MKQWLETREVLDRLAELLEDGKGAALATVVGVRGSAYRREGAKMLVAEDGSSTGNVSGGCLEADVREVALRVLGSGAPELRSYCAGPDEVSAWDLGVGCDGQVDVLVERTTDARSAERELLDGDVPFASCWELARPAPRLVLTRSGVRGGLEGGALDGRVAALARSRLGEEESASAVHAVAGHDVFVDVFTPPPRLVIVSAGDDARPLARLAAEIGFRVVVVDRRPALLTPGRFPAARELVTARPEELARRVAPGADTYAVVMTHNYVDDRAYLGALAATPVRYIGMLGPRQRTERIRSELAREGPVEEAPVHGPVGLDIGADGPEQVALSALAEILAVRSGRRPVPLRERTRPIHVPSGAHGGG